MLLGPWAGPLNGGMVRSSLPVRSLEREEMSRCRETQRGYMVCELVRARACEGRDAWDRGLTSSL